MFFLGECSVSWQLIKQKVVALSSCEAEYIATSTCGDTSSMAVQAARGAAWQEGGCGGVEGGQQFCPSSGQEPVLP